MQAATLVDVARECELAVSTVSRILNGLQSKHRPETTIRVLDAAAKLGYRPNMAARGMKQGSRIVGILSNEHGDSFFAAIRHRVTMLLMAAGYLPAFFSRSPDPEDRLGQISMLLDYRVEGVITIPELTDRPADYDALVAHGVPVVTVNLPMPGEMHCDFSGTDDLAGGRLAAQHLLGLGHRHALLLTARTEYDQLDYQGRVRGFAETFHAGGGTTEVHRTTYEPEPLAGLADLPYTCVFAVADHFARRYYIHAWQTGVRIPQDVSVVGFADLEFARFMIPPLTTVRQDGGQIGANAVEMLLRRLAKSNQPRTVTEMRTTPELVVRESTGTCHNGCALAAGPLTGSRS